MAARVSAPHVVMVLAGALAGLATLAVLRDDAPSAQFAVATRDLAPGTVLGKDVVDLVVGRADEPLLDDVVRRDDLESFEGAVLTRALDEGAAIRRTDFADRGAEAIPRTYSFSVPRGRAVAGELVVGDRVDVLAVDASGTRAEFVATGVDVVAFDDGGNGPLGTGDEVVITITVDERSALSIAAALERGSVSLVRSTGARDPAPAPFPAEDDAPAPGTDAR